MVRGGELEGMMSGASIFGDKGCFGDPGLGVGFWLDSSLAILVVVVSDIAISAFSSNTGPYMPDAMLLSENMPTPAVSWCTNRPFVQWWAARYGCLGDCQYELYMTS